eukprot:m.160451 g.160451  ORF g.160451 m.160451 type:complete len:409 (-) comp18026_c0_seq1:141-1367(-)
MCDSAPVSPGPDVPDNWFKNIAKAYWDHDIHDDDTVPPWQLSGDLTGSWISPSSDGVWSSSSSVASDSDRLMSGSSSEDEMYVSSPRDSSHCSDVGEFVPQFAMELDYLPTLTTLAATRTGSFNGCDSTSHVRNKSISHAHVPDMDFAPCRSPTAVGETIPELLEVPRARQNTHKLVHEGSHSLQLPQITLLENLDETSTDMSNQNVFLERLPIEQSLPSMEDNMSPRGPHPSNTINTAGGVKGDGSANAKKNARRNLGGTLTPQLIAAHTQAHAASSVATSTLGLQRAVSRGLGGRSHSAQATGVVHVRNSPSRGTKTPVVKKHVCSDCGKGFVSASKLQRHMAVHTGDKPFACTICDTRFTQKSALKVHQKRHEQSGTHGSTKMTGRGSAPSVNLDNHAKSRAIHS